MRGEAWQTEQAANVSVQQYILLATRISYLISDLNETLFGAFDSERIQIGVVTAAS
jgi:hypothetical protein